MTITTRPAQRHDIDVLLSDVQAGFDSYVEFAPEGWRPPDAFANRAENADVLGDPATWALIASNDGVPIGHIAFMPARNRIERSVITGLAHLWQLFVLPEWWGRGIAPMLHEAAVEELHARGYGGARLYTPALHTRARRFYERRGWRLTSEEWNHGLHLSLVEYRLALRRSSAEAR